MRARWLSCLHCRLTARRSWVRFPHGALLALGGRSSPECTVLRWVISRAFLCGVCMFSPCSQGVSSNKNPNTKNMQKQNILLSVRDRDGRFTWSPGAEKLPTAPGGSWRKDGPGWVKCRAYISQRRQACVCVCPVSPPYIHVCVPV